jgi:hypothetical protein
VPQTAKAGIIQKSVLTLSRLILEKYLLRSGKNQVSGVISPHLRLCFLSINFMDDDLGIAEDGYYILPQCSYLLTNRLSRL